MTLGNIWYKNAVIYERNARSFVDSNADEIGGFPELGVTGLWLFPFHHVT